MLRARGEEDGLVGDAQEDEQDERGREHRRRERRRDQGPNEERLVRDVERDAEERASIAAEDGETGEQWHLRGARPEEVERAADGRGVPAGERSAPAAEAEALEHHAPEDRL